VDALPELVRAAVAEVQAFTKAPAPLVASSALAALSLSIQGHYNVKRAENLSGPTSLYLLTIADSGERKTQCDRYFTRALLEYERQQAEALKPKVTEYIAALEAWKAKCDGVKASIREQAKGGKDTRSHERSLLELEQDRPQPPKVPHLIRGDETPEHLAYALMHEWPSAGVMSSETGLIFGAHGMGRESIMRNLSLLNILWDGGRHQIGRRTSESFTVQGARLTVGLQLQEATLLSFFDRSNGLARGTGFLARFLIAWPESTMGTRTFCDAGEWTALAAFDKRISQLLARPVAIDEQGSLSPEMLTLSPSAKRAWIAFHDAVEHELRSGGE
jgi:putative DNA primase/helicase